MRTRTPHNHQKGNNQQKIRDHRSYKRWSPSVPPRVTWDTRSVTYDAFLLLSFGGPEGPDDVLPFLENVTRGRGVPPERLAEVAGHYRHFGGVSPINEQCRALIAALEPHLDLPVYWGNRNWHP